MDITAFHFMLVYDIMKKDDCNRLVCKPVYNNL